MASSRPDPGFWSGKSVAVTGGAGFLGRPTVALLEELGADVRTIRSSEHDLRDREACRDALRGAQVVVHLAANVGGIGYNRRNPGPLAHDNLAMGLNVFEACRELGAEKLVAALGERGKLPIEIVPYALPLARRQLAALGLDPVLRTKPDGASTVTDNGNWILDCGTRALADAAALERTARALPGVVGTGLFLGMAHAVLVQDGTEVRVMERG